jgi:hypothetical protein
MRLISVPCICAALALVASAALADPASLGQKPWGYPGGGARATYPEVEPNDTCPGQQVACGDDVNPASLTAGDADWTTFTMSANDMLEFRTYSIDGQSTDTILELYASDCVTLLAWDDDGGGNLFSLIADYTPPYTGVYSLKVRGYSSYTTGNYGLSVRCTTQPTVENDICATAIDIPRCSAGSLAGDLRFYHNDYTPITGCTGYSANGKDAVYKMDLQTGDQVVFSYVQPAWDASLYAVTDCENLDCVDGADAGVTGDPETIQFTAASTGTFYIILDAYGTDTGGEWTADYSIVCPTPEACCFDDGSCAMLLAGDCRAQGGRPQGAGTNCDGVQCEVVPVQNTTWGRIKSTYH